jgi:hypothetical protein
MLRLAFEHGKLARPPMIRKLKEAPPRAGFFETEEFTAVRRHLRADLQLAVSLAYTYGWPRTRCSAWGAGMWTWRPGRSDLIQGNQERRRAGGVPDAGLDCGGRRAT